MDRKLSISALAVLSVVLSTSAVVTKKLPNVNVVENETISFESLKAAAVRSSNPAVFSAALREAGEAVVSGLRLGEARLDYVDDRGVFASRSVLVVPAYWDILKKMFMEDPEISVEIVGGKVVISGSTANVDTLRKVEQTKDMDSSRIVNQVSYSTAQIGLLVNDFLARSNVSNIVVNVVGREVCLSGKMYDRQSIDQLRARVETFVKDFPGITVNTDELKIYKQKILINIEFVQYDDNIARNLGVDWPSAISGEFDWTVGYGYEKSDSGSTETYNNGGKVSLGGTDNPIRATINLLKQNHAAKTVYQTSLSTQSGIEAEFQNGGTYYKRTDAGVTSSGGITEIEYGYIVKTTPFIIDSSTINLDLSLDNKQPDSTDNTAADINLSRYQTKSKYLIRPGESIVLSGFSKRSDAETKKGLPWFAHIPLIGRWLFGNTNDSAEMREMLLVVTVDWAVEDDTENVRKRIDAMKEKTVEVEMP